MPDEFDFLNSVSERRAVIAIIGLGNTGLPVAQGYVERGFPVCGIDVDVTRVDELRSGRSYLSYLSNRQIQGLMKGSFRAGFDFRAVAIADVIIVCVPTPLSTDGEAYICSVRNTFDAIVPYIKRGVLVMLQSTVPPGTTDILATRLAAKSGLALGTELFVAFAPERIDPANTGGWSVVTTPRVVGGVTEACARRASAVLEALCAKVMTVSNTRTAELTKLVENTFRMVNIVLANEISDVCRDLDVSEREVVEAASTKPFAFLAHRPGPGIGGDCIPVAPAFLLASARRKGIPTPTIAAAHRQIGQRPLDVVTRLTEILECRGRGIKGSKVLVLGVAYKENVNDIRNSPALLIIEKLRHLRVTVAYHDPLIPVLTVGSHRLESQPWDPTNPVSYDCAVLITAHSGMLNQIDLTTFPIVLDTRHELCPGGNVEWL